MRFQLSVITATKAETSAQGLWRRSESREGSASLTALAASQEMTSTAEVPIAQAVVIVNGFPIAPPALNQDAVKLLDAVRAAPPLTPSGGDVAVSAVLMRLWPRCRPLRTS